MNIFWENGIPFPIDAKFKEVIVCLVKECLVKGKE